MTSTVVRHGAGHPFPGQLREIIISCDNPDCTLQLNDTQIREGGGLKNMGWDAVPEVGELHHYCPDHAPALNKE